MESSVWVFVVVISLDEEVNDDGTLIDGDHFDGAGVDSKDCGNSVSKLDSTSISIELIHSPVETHLTLDSVFRFDGEDAARSQVEFKDVYNTDESVLSAPSLGERLIAAKFVVPLGDLLEITIEINGISASIGVGDANDRSSSVSIKLVAHLAGRSSSIGDRVVVTTLDEGREARQTELS